MHRFAALLVLALPLAACAGERGFRVTSELNDGGMLPHAGRSVGADFPESRA